MVLEPPAHKTTSPRHYRFVENCEIARRGNVSVRLHVISSTKIADMWLLMTCGRGPNECEIAVKRLINILIDEAVQAGIEAVLLDVQATVHGYRSALIALDGSPSAFVASWEGTIKWICPSAIRNTRRKNWFVAVSVIRPPLPVMQLRDTDLQYEMYRASGPGGQHVNKTSSAVRVTHVPTGLVAQAQEERSQHRNKALAVARLAALLVEQKLTADRAAEQEKWSKHDTVERGNSIRVYRELTLPEISCTD